MQRVELNKQIIFAYWITLLLIALSINRVWMLSEIPGTLYYDLLAKDQNTMIAGTSISIPLSPDWT